MKVGLVVDNPKRDLKGLLILAKVLAERGVHVYLVPMYNQVVDALCSEVDVLVVNYLRDNNRDFIAMCHGQGMSIVVMDTEGGILSEDGYDSPDNWAKYIHETGMYNYVSGYLFWGSKIYDSFVKYSGIPKNKLYVTGCPRYDQCHAEWKSPANSRYSDHILVNMNFSAVNPRFNKNLNDEKKAFESVGWDEQYVESICSELSYVLPQFTSEIKSIASQLPDKVFIVRPHPFEDEGYYHKAFSALPNVVVDAEGDVFDAISSAQAVLHLNCGTAVDSLVAGVPPISLEYLNNSLMLSHAPLPSKVSMHANSQDELIEMLSQPQLIYRQLIDRGVFDKYIKGYFHECDGNAAYRVADALLNISKRTVKPGRKKKNKVFSILKVSAGFKQAFIRLLCLTLGSLTVEKVRVSLQPGRREKNLTLESVVNGIPVHENSEPFNVSFSVNSVGLSNTAIEIIQK